MPGYLEPGGSTAYSENLRYRLSKLAKQGMLYGRWLDCGCASGDYTRALAQWGVDQAVGVELDPVRLLEATTDDKTAPNVLYGCASAESLPFEDSSFDGVLLNEVLEHVRDEDATLREIWRVLRKRGYLVLMSPNRYFPFEGHGMRLRGFSVPFPVPLLPWMPIKLGLKVMTARNYWPGELCDLVRRANFEILRTSSILPVMEAYVWLPSRAIRWYRRMMPTIERTPFLRRFGVSTLIVARRSATEA